MGGRVGRLAIVIGAVAFFALWACFPAPAFRSAVPPPPGKTAEVGVGGGIVYERADRIDPVTSERARTVGTGQVWYMARERRADIGVNAFVLHHGDSDGEGGTDSSETFFGGGGGFRLHLADADRFKLDLGVEAGWLYLGVGVPMAVRLADGLWLTTHPNVSLFPLAMLPVGLAVQVDYIRFELEGGVMYGIFALDDSTWPSYFGGLSIAIQP